MAQQIITNLDVQIYMMDLPQFNTLINGTNFTQEQINAAVLNTVDLWNTMSPPCGASFSVEKFPWRYLLLIGAVSYLLRSLCINNAFSQFTYSADGIVISDKDKASLYLSIAKNLKEEFDTLATNIKLNMNISNAFGHVSSEYAGRYYQ